MFSGSWKESNMLEINLEIPDQNIDTEGVIWFPSIPVCFVVNIVVLTAVCACSSPGGVRVSVSGRCSDQAQPGHQCSGCCLHATVGRFDPAVCRDHEGKHQRQDCVWILCQRQYLWLGLSHEKVRIASLIIYAAMKSLSYSFFKANECT